MGSDLKVENDRAERISLDLSLPHTHKQGNEHHKVRQLAPLRKPSHTTASSSTETRAAAAGRRWKDRVFPLGSFASYFAAFQY